MLSGPSLLHAPTSLITSVSFRSLECNLEQRCGCCENFRKASKIRDRRRYQRPATPSTLKAGEGSVIVAALKVQTTPYTFSLIYNAAVRRKRHQLPKLQAVNIMSKTVSTERTRGLTTPPLTSPIPVLHTLMKSLHSGDISNVVPYHCKFTI
ncbi:hypothetical protein E2C01_063413 [Portunus trituberculatus]|uniref:Uncharacterized protein n=1 Tax=Portunus trituberculatus TaxID=210409 RepID=A0A5B7HIW5_PORTR|nr:hypothetical protein [Portunus trituberculatus]